MPLMVVVTIEGAAYLGNAEVVGALTVIRNAWYRTRLFTPAGPPFFHDEPGCQLYRAAKIELDGYNAWRMCGEVYIGPLMLSTSEEITDDETISFHGKLEATRNAVAETQTRATGS